MAKPKFNTGFSLICLRTESFLHHHDDHHTFFLVLLVINSIYFVKTKQHFELKTCIFFLNIVKHQEKVFSKNLYGMKSA